jgi:hypothetical protein
VLVWLGIGIATAALLLQVVVFDQGIGAGTALLGVLLVVVALLAWRAASGERLAKLALLVASVALIVVGGAFAILAVAFSAGQSPLTDVIGWVVAPIGGLLTFLGSIRGLRS